MTRKRSWVHPVDEDLLGIVDEEPRADPDIRAHIKACPRCTERIAELRATRRLLASVALGQQHPQHDVARRAMLRLRSRRTVISGMNEIFAAFRALVRGMNELFGGAPPGAPPGPHSPKDEGLPHG